MNSDTSQTFDRTRVAIIGFGLIALAAVAINVWRTGRVPATANARNQKVVRQLVSSEEMLLELTPALRPLSEGVMHLQLPDSVARSMFAAHVQVDGTIDRSSDSVNSRDTRPWVATSTSAQVARDDLQLWQALFSETERFENAKFYFIRGGFVAENTDKLDSIVGFDGLAVYRDGRYASLHAELAIAWTRQPDASAESRWQIGAWKLMDLKTVEASGILFRDVLPDALDSEKVVARATVSRHDQLISELTAGKDHYLAKGVTYPFFFADVTLEHPGVSVVDINDDGFDDLYVAMQHDVNLLFRNRGDGTFEEVAAKYGLDINGDCTSAIFADFDNDGDPDLFLGRGRQPLQYLVNRNGTFVDQRSQLIDYDLPGLVSSISATDYNGDGLLDVYLCTYSPIEPLDDMQQQPVWVRQFLSPTQASRFAELVADSHRFLSRTGPPNVLLKNVGGGKFELAPENEQLELWRMSFQASWHDFDSDGDPDVYVANDYAPDTLLRNDGVRGFTDVTREIGITGMGFGMGVSWADYDNDNQTDIYVSNMFSKAGDRITSQVAGINPRLREMAAGNFLYQGGDNKFELVSGRGQGDMQVDKAGWSWGGQFFDFNNDGFRDIYVVSGYYTAPPDIAVEVDL